MTARGNRTMLTVSVMAFQTDFFKILELFFNVTGSIIICHRVAYYPLIAYPLTVVELHP